MDDPVTDVVFVSDPQNCPFGYSVLTECPCGHSAQLWEKVYGGEDNTRYLCFTKDPNADPDDKVVESLYIPGGGTRYLLPGYEVIARTEEGERDPLRHKQLAVKKVPRKSAKKVVADIVVAKGKDHISKLYTRLEKINGVRICFRQTEYAYKPSAAPRRATFNINKLTAGTAKLSMKTIGKSQSEERLRSDESVSPTAPSAPVIEETVAVKLVKTVASAPPPSMLNSAPPLNVTEQADSPSDQTPYPPPPHNQADRSPSPYQQPATSHQQPPPNTVSYQQPPANTASYQQPPPSYSDAARFYPPPAGYGTTQQYPPLPGGYSNSQQYPPQPTRQPQAYSPAAPSGGYPAYAGPPPVTTGYDTNIGFSFGGASTSYPTSQSAQYPPTQYGGPPGQYPPAYPPATTGQLSQAAQNSQPSYGFNF